MTGIATAIGVGAAATAGAAVYSSNKQASASKNAQNIAQTQYQQDVTRNQPFTQAGYDATGQLEQGLGIGGDQGTGGYGSLTTPFTTSNWQQLSPAYNFQLAQGQQGVLNSDAAGAGALSGSALKDLTNYNQSAANTSFNNAFNQYQTQQGNIFSRLSSIASLGQNSANNTGQQGTSLANTAAQSATNVGTAEGNLGTGVGNAVSGGSNSLAGYLYASQNPNNNPSNWDTENPNNLTDFLPGQH
jgi:hypothetical protein